MFHRVQHFAQHFLIADTPALPPGERRKSALGAGLGLLLAGALFLLAPTGQVWLLAPLGASAIILFALPHSPLAQPWSVLGGYLAATGSALLALWLVPPLAAAALAVGLSVWLMIRFRCVHPPGGALALLIVAGESHSPHGAWHLLGVVVTNGLAILAAAWVVNNLLLRRAYPQCRTEEAPSLHATTDPAPSQRIGLSHEDLDHALRSLGTFVDTQESELVRIYNLAVRQAFDRHLGLRCGDIMARDIVTVEYGTELESAWKMLRHHKIKAIPVVDPFRRVIGILTVADFLRQLDDTTAAGLAAKLQGLLRRTPGLESEKAEVVGQIMTAEIYTASVDTPVAELVHRLSDLNFHHIPVVDEQKKVIGMVTQSDLIAAMYQRIALSAA